MGLVDLPFMSIGGGGTTRDVHIHVTETQQVVFPAESLIMAFTEADIPEVTVSEATVDVEECSISFGDEDHVIVFPESACVIVFGSESCEIAFVEEA